MATTRVFGPVKTKGLEPPTQENRIWWACRIDSAQTLAETNLAY
jgi:hypothetical protein